MLKILVVDDNEEIRELLSVALAGPYTVHTAPDLDEARRILSSKKIDILFLDVWLSGKDGTELITFIKKRGLQCKIILITGDKLYNTNRYSEYIDNILYKPFNLSDVVAIAGRALEKKLENLSKDIE